MSSKVKFNESEIALIPDDWNVKKIGDVCQHIRKSFQPNDEDIRPYIGLEHINEGSLTLNSIGSSSDVKSGKLVFHSGQILFGKLRPYFRKVYRPNFDGVCSTDILVIDKKANNNNSFLFYFFANPLIIDIATQSSEGTKMPRASWNYLIDLEFAFPSLNEQKAIGGFLSTLDQKIFINNKMNQTLEEIGQALFHHWFVNFEFRNNEGRPYKSSDGDMEDSKLGEIPVGWKVKTIEKTVDMVTDYVANGSFASLKENVTYKNDPDFAILIRLVDYNRNFSGDFVYVDEHAYNFLKKSKLFGNEIVISNVGANVGTVFRAPFLNKPMTLGPNAIMIHSKKFDNLLYFYFTSPKGQHALKSITSGSAHPKFNKTDFRRLEIVVPPVKIIEDFNHIISNINKQITVNTHQNDNLSQIRDSLLPKLMSGKIRVNIPEEATAK